MGNTKGLHEDKFVSQQKEESMHESQLFWKSLHPLMFLEWEFFFIIIII